MARARSSALLLCALAWLGCAGCEAPQRSATQLAPNEINWHAACGMPARRRAEAQRREARRPRGDAQQLRVGHSLTQQALRLDEDAARCVPRALLGRRA